MTQTDLARWLGVSRLTVSELLLEKRGLSPEIAVRIGRMLNTRPESWLRMQEALDVWKVHQHPEKLAAIQPIKASSLTIFNGGHTTSLDWRSTLWLEANGRRAERSAEKRMEENVSQIEALRTLNPDSLRLTQTLPSLPAREQAICRRLLIRMLNQPSDTPRNHDEWLEIVNTDLRLIGQPPLDRLQPGLA